MSGILPPRGTLVSAQGGPATSSEVRSEVRIGGTLVPVEAFDVTSGSYGSVGHASMTLSRTVLQAVSIDLVTLSSSSTVVPVTIYATDQGPLGTGTQVQIFDGDVVSSEWEMDEDSVTVHARDHAGVFVDQKRVLTRDVKPLTSAVAPLSPGQVLTSQGIATVNRKISQVVSDIATEFGYTPILRMGPGTDVTAGASYGGGDHSLTTIPMNLWTLLNTLARDTGNEVYTTPLRQLVFGIPGAELPRLSLSWLTQGQQGQAADAVPVANLCITHNPRRNSTFRVIVTSYDNARAVATIGRATWIGSNLATPSLTEGLHSGAAAKTADSQLVSSAATKGQGSSADLSHVQLYTFHWDGMTNDDADARAGAIATDIAKRLLLMRGTLDGYPRMTPTQPVSIWGPLPQLFTGNTWYISGYRHRFRMPHGGSSHRMRTWEGFTTEFQALDLPSTSLASTAR